MSNENPILYCDCCMTRHRKGECPHPSAINTNNKVFAEVQKCFLTMDEEETLDVITFTEHYFNIELTKEQKEVVRTILKPTERAKVEMKRLGIEL